MLFTSTSARDLTLILTRWPSASFSVEEVAVTTYPGSGTSAALASWGTPVVSAIAAATVTSSGASRDHERARVGPGFFARLTSEDAAGARRRGAGARPR